MLCAGIPCEEGTEMVTMPDFVETELPDAENRIREGLFELPEKESFTPLSVQFSVINAVRIIISVNPGDVVEVWPFIDECCGIVISVLWWWLFPCMLGLGGKLWINAGLYPFFVWFFFLMEISLRTPVPLFKPGLVDDGLDSWVNYGWAFPDKCFLWAGFPDSFHCVPGQQSQPTQTLLGEGRMGVMV